MNSFCKNLFKRMPSHALSNMQLVHINMHDASSSVSNQWQFHNLGPNDHYRSAHAQIVTVNWLIRYLRGHITRTLWPSSISGN